MRQYTLNTETAIELMLKRHGLEHGTELVEQLSTTGTAYDVATSTEYNTESEDGENVSICEDEYMIVYHLEDSVEAWSADCLFEAMEKRDDILGYNPEADVEIWPLRQAWTGLDADNLDADYPLASSPADSDRMYVLWAYESEASYNDNMSLYNCLVFDAEDAKRIAEYEECFVELVEYDGDLETWFTGDWLEDLGEQVLPQVLPQGWDAEKVAELEGILDDWFEPWDFEEGDREFIRTEPAEALRLFIENDLDCDTDHADYEEINRRAYALQEATR